MLVFVWVCKWCQLDYFVKILVDNYFYRARDEVFHPDSIFLLDVIRQGRLGD
jgi:hypothetical protein